MHPTCVGVHSIFTVLTSFAPGVNLTVISSAVTAEHTITIYVRLLQPNKPQFLWLQFAYSTQLSFVQLLWPQIDTVGLDA